MVGWVSSKPFVWFRSCRPLASHFGCDDCQTIGSKVSSFALKVILKPNTANESLRSIADAPDSSWKVTKSLSIEADYMQTPSDKIIPFGNVVVISVWTSCNCLEVFVDLMLVVVRLSFSPDASFVVP